MADRGNKKEPEITFFHPALLEIPTDGSPAYLKGYRCLSWGRLDFPKLSPCPSCWGEEFDVVPLSRTGKLYSATDIFVGQAGMKTPYSFGYVDLPENLRIFCQLEGEIGSFRCDDDVELTVGTIRTTSDSERITSYKFKKVGA